VTRSHLTVLVLAVGGNVSQGILKALALSRLSCRVIGADVHPMKLGLYTVDRAYVSPWARDPGFLDWLIETCRSEGVQAILTGAEPILPVLAEHAGEIQERTGARCIVSDPSKLAIGDDKLLTCHWLEEHRFNCPAYAASEDTQALEALAAAHGYPLVAKRRTEGGCRGLIHVEDPVDLAYVGKKEGYLVQEYVGHEGSEYTAGCFCARDGRVRGAIVMHRELHEGTTVQAQVGAYPTVRDEAVRIAQTLRPMGPCNIQLRMAGGRPVCFEINIRFSGTTPVRARLGFNEVEEALRHFVLGEPARDLPTVASGIMLRYWNEMYVDPDACETLGRTGRLDDPQSRPLQVEDYGMRRAGVRGP